MIALFALLALQTTAEQRCFDLSKGIGLLRSITQLKGVVDKILEAIAKFHGHF